MDNLNMLVTGLHVKDNNTLDIDTLFHMKTTAVNNHSVLIMPLSWQVGALRGPSVRSSIGSTLGALSGLEPVEFPPMIRERGGRATRSNIFSRF
jgi:hypothetical protein